MTGTGADVDKRVAEAWARVEAGLSRVLMASLRRLNTPAVVQAIDAVETALAVPLPQEFRASLRIHNGTYPGPTLPSPNPSPIPLECLYDTNLIIERTRMWRDSYHPEPNWDDPRVWAYMVDRKMLWLNGPVRSIIGSPGTVVVGDTNGDVRWLLDFDPAPGGTPGQVVRVGVECSSWDVLAPSWTQLLVRYAEDLELFAADPDYSTQRSMTSDRHANGAAARRRIHWGCVRHGCWTFKLVIRTRTTGRRVRPTQCSGAMNETSDARSTVSTSLMSSARWTGTIRVAAAWPALTRTPTAGGGITRTRPGEVRP